MESDQAMALAVARAMDKSAALLRGAAEAGDSEAQFSLAFLYLLGRGVKQNAAEAFRLFGLASDAGAEQAADFQDIAAEQLAREAKSRMALLDAAAYVLKDAKRRKEFPKPKIVKSD